MTYSYIKTIEKIILAFLMALVPGLTATTFLPETAEVAQANWFLLAASIVTALAKGYDNYRKNSSPPDPPSSDARIELDYATLPASLLAYIPFLPVAGAGVTLSMIGFC